jgi:hypothetical protein
VDDRTVEVEGNRWQCHRIRTSMRPGLTDTDPAAERVQLDLLRRAGATRRVALALSLSRSMIELSRRGLRRSHPGASERALALLFVALSYGSELADGLRAYWADER